MTDKEEIEALQLENSTLRDIVDEQNESISELQQQVAALQEALENSKAAEHAAAQVRCRTILLLPFETQLTLSYPFDHRLTTSEPLRRRLCNIEMRFSNSGSTKD